MGLLWEGKYEESMDLDIDGWSFVLVCFWTIRWGWRRSLSCFVPFWWKILAGLSSFLPRIWSL